MMCCCDPEDNMLGRSKPLHTTPDLYATTWRWQEGLAKGDWSDQGPEKLPDEHESENSQGIKSKATKSQVVWMEHNFPKWDSWNTCPNFFLGQNKFGNLVMQ